jgi:hypothetical protein
MALLQDLVEAMVENYNFPIEIACGRDVQVVALF